MRKDGQEIQEFGGLLDKAFRGLVKIQTHWAIVQDVDWEAKTMTVKGVADDLEFYDVLLGIGSRYTKPVKGTRCLVGLILNQEASTFLIDAEEIEGFEIMDTSGFKCLLNDGLLTINGDGFGGLVKAPELKTQIDKNTAILQAIQQAIQTWVPVSQDGGAAFKTALSSVPGMQRADLGQIQNETIKHGG